MEGQNFEPMAFFTFKSHIEYYIRALLKDPLNAQPDKQLQSKGFDGETLEKMLIDNNIITRKESVKDHDKNKRPIRVIYVKKYHVEDNPELKIKRLWQRLFQQNINESLKLDDLEESTAGDVGQGFVTPLFGGPIRKKLYITEKQAEMIKQRMIDEATTTTNSGDYQYTVPFGGDTDTLARHNGKGGSISIPNSKV